MTERFLDFVDELHGANSEDDILAISLRHLNRLGIHILAWTSNPFSAQHRYYFTNFDRAISDEWHRKIDENKRVSMVWHSMQRGEFGPIAWGTATPQTPHLSRTYLEFCACVADRGCTANLCIPIWNPQHKDREIITFGSPLSAQEFPSYQREYASTLYSAACALSARMATMRCPITEKSIFLTARETECLTWMAAGLRHDQIAERIGISEWTVMYHLKNARTKLGAATNEQAVALAIVGGVIVP